MELALELYVGARSLFMLRVFEKTPSGHLVNRGNADLQRQPCILGTGYLAS